MHPAFSYNEENFNAKRKKNSLPLSVDLMIWFRVPKIRKYHKIDMSHLILCNQSIHFFFAFLCNSLFSSLVYQQTINIINGWPKFWSKWNFKCKVNTTFIYIYSIFSFLFFCFLFWNLALRIIPTKTQETHNKINEEN